jgi:hypothetical protein
MKHAYTISDTLNLKDPIFDKRNLLSYKELLSSEVKGYMPKRSYEERSNMLAKKIINALWECIMEDLLENDVTIILSTIPLIEFKISFLRNFNSSKYFYREKTKGKFYKLIVILGRKISDSLNAYYFASSRDRLKKEIVSRIDQGYTWS